MHSVGTTTTAVYVKLFFVIQMLIIYLTRCSIRHRLLFMIQFKTKRINLALQDGGSHGAFTWGVLDRLLQDERLEIEAITGTSSGAINAAARYMVLPGAGGKAPEALSETSGICWAANTGYSMGHLHTWTSTAHLYLTPIWH